MSRGASPKPKVVGFVGVLVVFHEGVGRIGGRLVVGHLVL